MRAASEVTELLPARLRLIGAAAAAGPRPRGLGPAPAGAGRRLERGPPHRDDVWRRGRPADPVAIVAGARGDRYARVAEVGVVLGLVGSLIPAPAVAHLGGTQADRGVLGGDQVGGRLRRRLHQQQVAISAGPRDHVQVDGDLRRPLLVVGRIVGAAALVHLAEAAVGGGASGKAELRPVDVQVGLGAGIVVGVDDRDGVAGPRSRARRRQRVRRLEVGRRVALGSLAPADLGSQVGEAAHLPGRHRTAADRLHPGGKMGWTRRSPPPSPRGRRRPEARPRRQPGRRAREGQPAAAAGMSASDRWIEPMFGIASGPWTGRDHARAAAPR